MGRAGFGGTTGYASDLLSGGRGFDPRRVRLQSFLDIYHKIFATVILSLPLIQGQLSVSGEGMCTCTGRPVRELSLPRKSVIR